MIQQYINELKSERAELIKKIDSEKCVELKRMHKTRLLILNSKLSFATNEIIILEGAV